MNDNKWVNVVKGGIRNANDRVYSNKIVRRIKKKLKEQVDKNTCMIALDTKPNDDMPAVLPLHIVAGIVTDVKYKGGLLSVKWKTLDTPCGKIVTETLNRGDKLNLVFNGISNIEKKEDGSYHISDDYEFGYLYLTTEPSSFEGLI